MKTSVIIASKNRPNALLKCIWSIQNCFNKNLEIVLCIQDAKSSLTLNELHIHKHQMVCIDAGFSGKSRALNLGLKQTKGDIIMFTDDDCIVDKHWIKQALYSLQKYQDIEGVFGKTLPYIVNSSMKEDCPSCFNPGNKSHIVTQPTQHWKNIGFGNNMAFRKEAFDNMGGFKYWLGPGSIGSTAEDAEFALRALIKRYKLLYNPNMIVYHNKWLTPKQMQKQQLSYACGEMACYGYFSFQGHQFAKPVVWSNIKNSYYKIRRIIKKIIFFDWNRKLIIESTSVFFEVVYRVRGLMVGCFFALIDPLGQ